MTDPVNHNVKDLDVAGVGHRTTNAWFVGNNALQPTSFGGGYVQSVAFQGTGTYLITLAGFVPQALISVASSGGISPGQVSVEARAGAVQISPTLRQTTVVVYTSFGTPRALISFGPASGRIKLSLHWKMFFGTDRSGL